MTGRIPASSFRWLELTRRRLLATTGAAVAATRPIAARALAAVVPPTAPGPVGPGAFRQLRELYGLVQAMAKTNSWTPDMIELASCRAAELSRPIGQVSGWLEWLLEEIDPNMAWAGIEPHLRGLSPEQMTKVLESVSRHNAYYWRVRPPVESGKEPVVFDHLDRSACERFVQAVYRDESMWEGFFHAIMNVSMSENDAADAIENICGIIDDELVKECSPGRRRDSPARFVSRFMTALQESACLRGPFVRMAVECHYLYPRALRMREIGDTVEIPTRLEADLLRSLRTSILSYAREKLPGWLNIIRWRLRRFVCDATGRSLVSADMRRLRDFLDSRSDDEILRPSWELIAEVDRYLGEDGSTEGVSPSSLLPNPLPSTARAVSAILSDPHAQIAPVEPRQIVYDPAIPLDTDLREEISVELR